MKEKIRNILIYLITLFIAFIICEFGFRLYSNYNSIYSVEMHKYALKLKTKSKIAGLTHEHIKNSNAVLQNVEIKINEFGFRTNELKKKIINEFRTMVLGSSITMGWGVKYDSVFTTLLEKISNEIEKKIFFTFYNLGIGNYNTEMQIINFKNTFEKVNPDRVILHYFINDAEIINSGTDSWFVKNSYLIAYFYVKMKETLALREAEKFDIGKYYLNLYNEDNKGWIKTKSSILELKDLCIKNNIELITLIQPDLHDLSKESAQNKCMNILKNFLTNNTIQYIDISEDYRKKFLTSPKLLWAQNDDSHPNSTGHQILAKRLIKFYDK